MKILFLSVIATTLAALTSCGSSIDLEAERQSVQAINDEIIDALENTRVEILRKHMADDWEVFITPKTGWLRYNKEQFLKKFEEGFGPPGNVKYTVHDSQWLVTPMMALWKAHFTVDFGLLKAPVRRVPLLATWIYEKRNDNWYWVHAHESYAPVDTVKH